MFYRLGRNKDAFLPRLQSHRGYWIKGLAQNSLDSIRQAFLLNYEMAEFDVRLSKDGIAMLFHDARFQKFRVRSMKLSVLREKTPISTLEEVFIWFQENALQSRFKLNIEIKSNSLTNRKLEAEVIRLIRKYKMEHRILISSFNPFTLMYFRLYANEVFRSLLVSGEREKGNFKVIRKRRLNFLCYPDALHLRYQDWNADLFKGLLAKKIPVVLWTCNDLELAKKFISEGVTGIISDSITPEQLK